MATGFSDSIPAGTAGVREPGDGFFRAVAGDAVDLAHAACGDVSWRAIVKTILTNDGFAILALWRMRVAVRYMRVPILNSLLRRIQTIVYGIEIGNDVTLGRGVYFVHPIGVVVGGTARVGDRVRFLGGNTVGTVSDNGCPVIGVDAVLGAGARVLGPIAVGARSLIGANAVVLANVPDDSVAVGIPAACRPRRRQAEPS